VPFPTFIIGPAFNVVGWARARHQSRRKVKLTVHRAYKVLALASFGGREPIVAGDEFWFITVTNASRDRDIVVTHIWIETETRVDVVDAALPVRLKYSAPWETSIPISKVPGDPERVPWLVRCLLSPDDRIVKSRPRKNVPPVGAVPRG
jgi:hypothetical protein